MALRDDEGLISQHFDVILVGAGLASTLTALRLKEKRPDLRICLLEARSEPDQQHTWCSFDSDVAEDITPWRTALLTNHWDGYQVQFPEFERCLTTGYGRLSAETLNHLRAQQLGAEVQYDQPVAEVASDHVILSTGRRLEAPLILDGRGAVPSSHLQLGYQKFVGLDVELSQPHGLDQPIVMDATVDQLDGYRFVYVLPLDANRVLVEDTRYSDTGNLGLGDLRQAIQAYVTAKGWQVTHEHGQEKGVLPILLDGDFDAYWSGLSPAAPLGLRALLFHPTTGYSFPHALRMADRIAGQDVLSTAPIRQMIEQDARQHWKSGLYLRLLNRMLFRAAKPEERYRVLQKFYRLPQPLIERFYAGQLSLADRARILTGKPPVSLVSAVKALRPKKESAHG